MDSPVIIGFHNQPTYIYEIPFPAVTICPESKVHEKYLNQQMLLSNDTSNSTYVICGFLLKLHFYPQYTSTLSDWNIYRFSLKFVQSSMKLHSKKLKLTTILPRKQKIMRKL